jgi:hypothetical protein
MLVALVAVLLAPSLFLLAPGESLRIRLLQLAVELIKAARPSLASNKQLRDVLTKWAWRHLKVPDESPCRTWGFLAIVHLLAISGQPVPASEAEAAREADKHTSPLLCAGQPGPACLPQPATLVTALVAQQGTSCPSNGATLQLHLAELSSNIPSVQ